MITFIEKNGQRKVIQYECATQDNAAEIIAKLRYLLKPVSVRKNYGDPVPNMKGLVPSLRS